MAIAFESGAAVRDNDQGESVSINAPASIAAGDAWIIIVSADADTGGGQPGVPSGFTAVDAGYGDADGGTYTRAFWKVAAGGDSGVTSTAVSGNWYDVVTYTIRFSGTHATTPVANPANNFPTSGGSNLTPSGLTVATTGNAAVCWLAGSASIAPITKPSNMTLIATDTTTWPAVSAAYATGLTAGTFNANAWTNTSADPAYTQIFEIVQAAAGGDPEGSLTGGKLIGGGLLIKGVLVP